MRVHGIRKIAIVGGGPSGIAAAKHLLAEHAGFQIDIFEQRDRVGGVWNYDPADDARESARCPVPHDRPSGRSFEVPIWHDNGKMTLQSPMYDKLEANLPKMLMQHSDMPFKSQTQLFPTRENILEYLHQYAQNVMRLVHFLTRVESVLLNAPPASHRWTVTTTNLHTSTQRTASYDAVLVASGHYATPYLPSYPGLSDFAAQHPNTIQHAKTFTHPSHYAGQTVLVVGLRPSGMDIAGQLTQHARAVHVSTRADKAPPHLPKGATWHPTMKNFDPPTRSVEFTNGDRIPALDAVIFCTGYLYTYPFLPAALQSRLGLAQATAARVPNVYKQLFSLAEPTLAFSALPWNIVPFPVAEVQGAVVARVWSGRAELPSQREMEEWEAESVRVKGEGKEYHNLAPPSDIEYINELWEWAESADPGLLQDNSDVGNKQEGPSGEERVKELNGEKIARGKPPPYWGPFERWLRMNVPAIKKAFAARGEQRKHITALEELGFVYNEQEGIGANSQGQNDGKTGGGSW